ncbi:MAG: carbohydrate kinase family protein, partial [Candidatus Berkelbacteria bacterium]|nr:carbohydrate kinase family protein [Candidatus Berkelbacteria bacterium]
GDAVSDIFIEPEDISIACPVGKIKQRTCFERVICLPFGDKIPISQVHYDMGGSAANVAVGLARQGFKAELISEVGCDQKAPEILERLREKGVHVNLVKKDKEINTNTSVIISYKGERTILVYRGLKDYSKIKIPKKLRTKWLFVGPLGEGFEKLYSQIIPLISQSKIKLAINPGSIQIDEGKKLKEILRITEIVFLNREEAEELCRARRLTPIKELLTEIKKMGSLVVVITDGAEGAYAFDGANYLKIGAYSARRREATGAGDSFSSGVLAAKILDKTIEEALQWGVVNSASVVEKVGAQNGLLTQNQIQSRLNKAPKAHQI